MQPRYLLYIDILGFKSLVDHNPGSIPSLYAIIDSLNAHMHDAFNTLVFSDTILVYSKDNRLKSEHDHKYAVMYSCEFAQDLMYRFVGTDFAFRAVLVHGEFDRYKLNRFDCFYGSALVRAHLLEREIKSIGLFIDIASQKHNEIFPVAKHSAELSYVFLNQHTQGLMEWWGEFPIADPASFQSTGSEYGAVKDVRLLKEWYDRANNDPDPDVRLKYLTAWNYQLQRYPVLLRQLMDQDFALSVISPDIDWEKVKR